MERVHVTDGRLVCAGRDYGPSDGVLAYPGEAAALGPGSVEGVTPHNIDLLFAVGTRVVGCEVKLPADWLNSWRNRRLHRQLRTLRSLVDVPVLVLRGGIDPERGWEGDWRKDVPIRFWEDLTNLQTLGVYILPVPRQGYSPWLMAFRRALATKGARAVAGDDRREKEQQPGWLLRRISGIGRKRSAELIHRFGSTWKVFGAARLGKVAPEFGPSIEAKIRKALEEK